MQLGLAAKSAKVKSHWQKKDFLNNLRQHFRGKRLFIHLRDDNRESWLDLMTTGPPYSCNLNYHFIVWGRALGSISMQRFSSMEADQNLQIRKWSLISHRFASSLFFIPIVPPKRNWVTWEWSMSSVLSLSPARQGKRYFLGLRFSLMPFSGHYYLVQELVLVQLES